MATVSDPLFLDDPRHHDANRVGVLSDSQRKWLGTRWFRSLKLAGSALLMAPAFGLLVTVWGMELAKGAALGLWWIFISATALGMGVVLGTLGRRSWQITRDLRKGEVSTTWGRLCRRGERWAVELDHPRGKWVSWPHSGGGGWIEPPPPGRYRVAYVPTCQWVVALDGEVARGMRPTAEITEASDRALGIDRHERAYLRRGQLGPRSRRRLLVLALARVAAVVAVVVWLMLDWRRLTTEPMWLVLVLLASGSVLLYAASRIRGLMEDRREGGVLQVVGQLRRTYRGPSLLLWRAERRIVVDNDPPHSFGVEARLFSALVSHLEYRVYFTPRSRTVVGIEPVDDYV